MPYQDSFTAFGAARHVKMIGDYWRGRGYSGARVWREEIAMPDGGESRTYVVRSNLVGGYPPLADEVAVTAA